MDKAKEAIVQKLKASGCRITKQRLMLLDIILEENCSCCKEIYYRASRIDPSDRIPDDQQAGGNRSNQSKKYV